MSIAENRRARFDYHIEERFEAGLVLEGWEIKAIRSGQVQLTDGYVVIRNGELFLIGLRVDALRTASTHVRPDAERTRKLLMHKDEIKGAAKQARGNVKEAVGKATGDRKLQADGAADKVEGSVQKAAGKVKQAARDALKH